MWQELRTELHPRGLEVVTVALDTGGADAARPFVEAASPDHPSLVDQHHLLGELLGVTNVPMAVWVDEQGVIVRGPEPAFPRRQKLRDPGEGDGENELPERIREMLAEARKIQVTDPEIYLGALRDWVENGSSSRYALPPDEVVRRSISRPPEVSGAAASFELGVHLWHSGERDAAARWWRDAHRLQPDNITYKRQAWQFADPLQGPTDMFEGDWLSEIRRRGAENYYPPVEL